MEFVTLFTDFYVEAKLNVLERLISVPITYGQLQNTVMELKYHIVFRVRMKDII
jgi:hypothetical protein